MVTPEEESAEAWLLDALRDDREAERTFGFVPYRKDR